jgi:hypothetical protein
MTHSPYIEKEITMVTERLSNNQSPLTYVQLYSFLTLKAETVFASSA